MRQRGKAIGWVGSLGDDTTQYLPSYIPDAQFTIKTTQMEVNRPYIEHLGIGIIISQYCKDSY